MSAQGIVTLNAKDYSPRGNISGIAQWALIGDTSFGGATSTLTESVKGPSKDGVYRVQYKLTIPKAASESDACACSGTVLATAIANIEVVLPSSMTKSERTDIQSRIVDLVGDAIFASSVEDLEPSW